MNKSINLVIFASGNGSNAERLIQYFKDDPSVKIKAVVCNNKDAFVLERAKRNHIPGFLIDKHKFHDPGFIEQLKAWQTDWIILAGFLWLIPETLIRQYQQRIVNIHPALLPKFGGKGMYGMNVHKAVIDAKEKISGISIHFVDKEYDNGSVLFQAECNVDVDDTPESLAKKIHELEYVYFPEVVDRLICTLVNDE